MADSGPWDDSDQREASQSSRRPQRSLRVSHLSGRSPRRHEGSSGRSRVGSDVGKKVQDLTSSLKATSEVLSTADRMLEHYRYINDDQDEEIRKLRSELDRSTEFLRQHRNQQHNRTRSQVRFADETTPEGNPTDHLQVSLRDLESGHRQLTKEIREDRDERARIGADNQRSIRRLEESFQRVEDGLRDSWHERERVRRGIDTEKEALSESVKLAMEKERKIKELRDQLRESQRSSQDEAIESKVRRIYDQEKLVNKEKKEVGELIEELKSVKNLMNETVSEKKMKEQMQRIKRDEGEIERSERERRLLNKLQTLDDKLEECERERRKLEQDLESAVKRLEWTEGGRSTLLKQIDELNKELKNSSEEKASVASNLRDYKGKLEESELLRERLASRMDSLSRRYENEEQERGTLLQRVERLNEKLRDKSQELAEKTEFAQEQEKVARESETKKEELKNRALETIKEYKIKWKKSEKDVERYKNDAEELKEELRTLRRHTDEGSGRSLALEKELKEVMNDRDCLKDELERVSKEVGGDLKNSKKRLNSALEENMNLEEKVASLKEEKKQLAERYQVIERKFGEETSRLNEEVAELKEGIRDIFGKKSRLEVKLKEEQSLREELATSLDEAKDEEAKAKEEVASLYRQLQRERDECNLSVKDVNDKMQKLREQSKEEIQGGQKRLQKQNEEFEEKLDDMKLQLADEKATVKALRKQQEKDGQEIENMRSELTRVKEEKIHVKQKYEDMQREAEAKDETREQNKSRIVELETEVRRCHRSLNRAMDEQKGGFQKVNEAIEELIEKFCEERSLSRPSTFSNQRSLGDSQNWATEIMAKLKWLEDEMKNHLMTEHGYKDQLNSYEEKVQDAFKKTDTDKAYFMSELDKQNEVLKELARGKKELEAKDRDNQDIIATLEKKIAKLTKFLDTSTKALQASISALEDKQKVLDDMDSLRGDQEERDRLRHKYVRYQERVGVLKRELSDAKTQAVERKQDTKDASNLSARLLESLNRLSGPRSSEERTKDELDFSSRLNPKDEFGSMEFLSSLGEGTSIFNEDHNFKTPDKVSVRDFKHKGRMTSSISARKSHHVHPEKD